MKLHFENLNSNHCSPPQWKAHYLKPVSLVWSVWKISQTCT